LAPYVDHGARRRTLMRVVSNAMMDQAEIVQADRWERGPLELVFLKDVEALDIESELHLIDWNRHHRAGWLRAAGEVDFALKVAPRLREQENPNVFLVPSVHGYTELHCMLASLVPEAILRRHGLRKESTNAWLMPLFAERSMLDPTIARKATASVEAFNEYLWPKLAGRRGLRNDFSPVSSLRLLASDTPYWMSRLYRLALARWDSMGPTRHEDRDWKSLDVLWEELRQQVPVEHLKGVTLSRPYYGGTLWDENDQRECDGVLEELLGDGGGQESLEPVLQVLNSSRTHEDFSDRYSWVKEDFERSFYSKRSKIRVSLVETVDDVPVWSAPEPEGYGNVLFRDVLSFFDAKDRHLVLALRHGKTVSEIAREQGLKGHASVSRRLKRIRAKVREVLKG